MKTFKVLFRLLRPYQWTKNLFIFAPLLFAKKLFNYGFFLEVFTGFLLFCLASSSVYIFNDITDIEQDGKHPKKKERPIASGKISLPFAISLAVTFGVVALSISFWIKPVFGVIITGYLALNMSYSIILKHVVILDVLTIAAGFVLRILGGAKLVDIYPSDWLIVCAILLSLFLGFSKRRHEIILLGEKGNSYRKVLEHYSPYFLDQLIGIVTASTVVSYMLYTISEETVLFFGTRKLIWTVPFVLYGIFRYLYLVHQKEEGGDPTKVMLTDIPLMINILLWVIACVIIIYT